MLIGLIGLAGAGKDTFTEQLQSHLETGFWNTAITRFAAPLKSAAEHVFGPAFDDRQVKEVAIKLTEEQITRVMDAKSQLAKDLGLSEREFGVYLDAFFHTFTPYLEGAEISPRLFQQLLGTECARLARDSCFRDAVVNKDGPYVLTLVPDVRFENEFKAMDCTILIRRSSVKPKECPVHVSEHLAWNMLEYASPRANISVNNEGSLEALDEIAHDVAHAISGMYDEWYAKLRSRKA